MALDAAMIALCARELSSLLKGARVDRIYMPARDEVLLALRTRERRLNLLLSARSGTARAHVTVEDYEFPSVPPSFCMLLRKHLGGGRITDITSAPDERIMFFKLEALSEMGDRVSLTVSLELMGRYSNLVLIDGAGTVIDALKRIDKEQSDKRQLYPGIAFTMPPTQGKLGFAATPVASAVDRIIQSDRPLSAAVLDALSGICPAVCREIAYRVDPSDGAASSLGRDGRDALSQTLALVKRAAEGDGCIFNAVYDGERPVEFSFIPLTQYTGLRSETFDTAGGMLERFFGERDRAERLKSRSFDLSRRVNSLYERAVRKQSARFAERDNSQKAMQKKLYGELVNANLHAIKKGQSEAELVNYYTGETVTVPLDVTRTPVQNAQKYYKEYKKLTTAAAMLEKLLREGEQEIKYLEQVKYEISAAKSEEDFLQIRRELRESGYLRGVKFKEHKNPRRASDFYEYRTTDGFRVLVGRNNASNEKLSLRVSDKRDIWFHVKDAAGSHTVLVIERATPSDTALTQAAEIAAFHSSASGSSSVAVDYTEIKNVRKAAGQKPGMVIYDSFHTAFVTPLRERVEALRVKEKQ